MQKNNNRHFRSVTWIAVCLMLVQITLTGCAPTPAKIRTSAEVMPGPTAFKRGVDEYGRPVFTPLSSRPTGTGEQFSMLQFEGSQPITSYDIVIKNDGDRDLISPVSNFFKNLLNSIGLGLALGSLFFLEYSDDEEDEDDWPDDVDSSDAFTVGFVIGTSAGLVSSVYNLGKDTGRVVLNRQEVLVSETYYNYDPSGRLTSLTSIPGTGQSGNTHSIKFLYKEGEYFPYKTVSAP